MFNAFEWMIAVRYLRARRAEGFISVIAWFSLVGIALGVATLIIVMAVMNGFRTELVDRILGLNGHISVLTYEKPITDFEGMSARIGELPGVVQAAPYVEGQVMITARNEARGALVRGLSVADLEVHKALSTNLRAGSAAALSEPATIMIGTRMAERFGLGVGDKVTLISPKGTTTVMGFVPRLATYKVVALFEVGMYEYDSSYIFMGLPQAQRYFRTGDGVTGIEVVLDSADDAAARAGDIYGMFAGAGIRVVDWQRANASFVAALQVERNVMFLILTLIILVAAFNIISSMIMLVKDKGRDIAILRTMGAARGSVMRVFLIAGASIGVVGTLTGFALGVVFCLNIDAIRVFLESLTGTVLWSPEIRWLSQIPARMETGEVVGVLLMALGLSFVATIYPAWRAARLDPVEALRYE
ncbi:MAG: lipoprotein-releasing ABC transporter permease subunit [Minwuia sp.]|nr:lipoprotein-releasing ABC transporter permease subunit [Minwuia sp.]